MSALELLDGILQQLRCNDLASMDKEVIIEVLNKVATDLKISSEQIDFAEIINHICDGIYITDGVGRTLYINEPLTKMTGIALQDVVGKYVADLENSGMFSNAVTPTVLKSGAKVESVAFVARSNVSLLLSGTPIFDEQNNIKNVVVVNRNVSDLVNAQNELAQTKEKMRVVKAVTEKKDQELIFLRGQQLLDQEIINSKSITEVQRLINQVAAFDTTVLITGETGTGKEVVANEIYRLSKRSNSAFIKLNCSAIPPNLLESELFGYDRGSFTGANAKGKIGLFELANKGTLLLDEIGDMPLELQPKILRVLQQKEFMRVGGSKPLTVDVRIIASTNLDLKKLVDAGKFREDLYYRLSVFPIHVSPLRERGDDLLALVDHFLAKYNIKYSKSILIHNDALKVMQQYRWPGNIRELMNVLERLVIVSEAHTIVTGAAMCKILDIEEYLLNTNINNRSLKETLQAIERETIYKVLFSCGSTREAARILGISQSAVVKKSQKLGISIKK